MSEIKPCPFCGGKQSYVNTPVKHWDGDRFVPVMYHVTCPNCKADIPGTTEQDAIAAWNERINHEKD